MTETIRVRPGITGAELHDLGPARCAPPKPKPRIPSIREIERTVKNFHIDGDDWTQTCIAAVLLLGAVHVGTKPRSLRAWSGYSLDVIEPIHHRLRIADIWSPEGDLNYFSESDPNTRAVEFTLIAMVGAGLLLRSTASPDQILEPRTNDLPLYGTPQTPDKL